MLYVSLEWNSAIGNEAIDPLDLNELVHESELVPMSNMETIVELQERKQVEKAEQLNIVDDNVELQQPDEELEGHKEEGSQKVDRQKKKKI